MTCGSCERETDNREWIVLDAGMSVKTVHCEMVCSSMEVLQESLAQCTLPLAWPVHEQSCRAGACGRRIGIIAAHELFLNDSPGLGKI